MSQKFWDLPQKYNKSPLKSMTNFKISSYILSERCLCLWLFSGYRTHKNFFSEDGDQLLENSL